MMQKMNSSLVLCLANQKHLHFGTCILKSQVVTVWDMMGYDT